MLQCHKETIARLFYNVSSSFLLLFIFFHFTSIFLSKLFIFFGGNPFYQRNRDCYVYFNSFSEEEVEEGDECSCHKPMEGGKRDANLIYGDHEPFIRNSKEELGRESLDSSEATCYGSPDNVEFGDEEVVKEDHVVRDSDSCFDSEEVENDANSNYGSSLRDYSLKGNIIS